jgi:Flp pilus assembly protein TadD
MILFGVTLAPALGFVNVYPFKFSFVADHFQYLANIAVIAFVAAGIARGVGRWAGSSVLVQAAVVLIVATALAALSWRQSHQYADAETLYRATIERNPGAWMAHHNLAAIEARGSAAGLEDAVAHAREAIRLEPTEADAHNTLGIVLQRQGRLEEAAARYAAAIALRPGRASAHNNLGTVRQAEGRLEEAAGHYAEAVRLEPRYGEAHRNLGLVLQGLNRNDEALAHLQEAVRLEPGSAVAHDALGTALLRQRRGDESVAEYRAAIVADAGYAEAHNNLGFALESLGRLDAAIVAYRAALRLGPQASLPRDNLGRALYSRANQFHTQNRLEEAVAQYLEALAFVSAPRAAEVHNDLGVALAGLGRLPEAREHFRVALRIRPDFPDARANLSRASGKVER